MATNLPNVTIAPGPLPRGPFSIEPITCGRLTHAQQTQFATNAKTGFVFKFTNNGTSPGDPKLFMNFLAGTTVLANSFGMMTPVSPGQSGEAEADGISYSGQPISFSACQIMGYYIDTGNGIDNTEYAG